ncbi:MAG TPA: site-specific integrase [Thermodesulforhabdus norvegica]|uniref:Site-specific integrase n=1 Tax=Thermodesulforhabdus norvegica TaxID=39841 RepID=A0A7C1B108_9BACT|nr:site-specific integrase [Thermodesulforhabdus norvegica]
MSKPAHYNSMLPSIFPGNRPIKYLTEQQVNALTAAWQNWYDSTKTPGRRMYRGRYWLTYLVLRFTGARISEVLQIKDNEDINFRTAEIRMPTLKRKKGMIRTVFVPSEVVAEIATYLAEYPHMRGKIFALKHQNFRSRFVDIALRAGIPRDLAHPHVLRHTRAIEMLRAGVPVTVVQDQLGHAYLSTTAVYLKISGAEARQILKSKGLI